MFMELKEDAQTRIANYLANNVSNMYSDDQLEEIDDTCQMLVDVLNINGEDVEIWVPLCDLDEYNKNSELYMKKHPEILDGCGVDMKIVLLDQDGYPI